ncbi:MAG: 16S rRNA (cytosine(1402)-N(4))-methyltransferase RsmH [Patescibacteria group bacterium]
MKKDDYHEPVLVGEVTKAFAPLKKARIIDATLGTGGHTLAMVRKGAEVLGIELDSKMLEVAERRLKKACPTPHHSSEGSFKLTHANFRNIDLVAQKEGFAQVDGVLFDLGVSNLQLLSASRGFSFTNPEAKLDMRIDPAEQGLTAADLLNALREDQLTQLFTRVLPRGEARFLARLVSKQREVRAFAKVGDFLRVVKRVRAKKDLHPATLPFLALRLAVNSELENLTEALPKAFSLLKKKGRLLVITFHSGEEKVVLDFFYQKEREKEGRILTRKPVKPSLEEVARNPRARSAELYILEKL